MIWRVIWYWDHNEFLIRHPKNHLLWLILWFNHVKIHTPSVKRPIFTENNQFQAETDYGKCVGPITGCSVDAQCSGGQKCVNERCSCENDVLELCLKNGIWECVKDPLPDCIEGILPSGKYGCCDQITGWSESDFDQILSHCQNSKDMTTFI